MEDLKGKRLSIPPPNSGTRTVVDDLFEIYGITQNNAKVDSTTKCNFEQLGKEAKDVLVSKASRPPSQSSHDLSTP